jgi:DNA end-binding protein Ku
MLDLATHIVETKKGKFQPDKFEDRYEQALKALIKKKRKGEKIETPKESAPSNVVDLMEALRRSVKGAGARRNERRKRDTGRRLTSKKASTSRARRRAS